MPKYRSATTTHGRNMAGARALWRATGMTDSAVFHNIVKCKLKHHCQGYSSVRQFPA
nr:hypothetical protein [Escherichia coli]